MAFAPAIGSYPYWRGYVSMRTGSNTKRYHQTQAPNASPKRYQQTLPLEVAFGAFTIPQQLTHRVSYILHKHAATH